jgi:hypothetical protein
MGGRTVVAATRKRGRPSIYTPKLAREICDRLSKGEPLAVICRDDHMPAVRTVSLWKETQAGFAADFTRARDEGYDAIAAECKLIADTPQIGERVEVDPKGKKYVVREDMLGHRKLQIETRLKLLAKWDPKRYGERLELKHGGGITVATHELSDAELEAIAAGSSAGVARKTPGEGES